MKKIHLSYQCTKRYKTAGLDSLLTELLIAAPIVFADPQLSLEIVGNQYNSQRVCIIGGLHRFQKGFRQREHKVYLECSTQEEHSEETKNYY